MAIAVGAAGAAVGGTTSLALVCPNSVTAGQLLVAGIGGKYPANLPSTPAGWTAAPAAYSGGSGASGVDAGQAYVIYFYKIADGTESGTTVNVTITGGNTCKGSITRFTKTAALEWSVAFAGGSSNTAGLAWAVTADVDPGLQTGDLVFAYSGVNSDIATWSTEAMTATGATFGSATERVDSNTANGDDCAIFASDHPVTAGVSSGVIAYSAVASTTLGNAPAGATIFMRLREIDGATAAITEAADTVVVTGTSTDNGALSITEDADGISIATGTSTDNGAISITEASDTIGATGTSTDNGALATTEADDTLVTTGTNLDNGAATITEAGDTLLFQGVGNSAIGGSLSKTEASDTLVATGTRLSNMTATRILTNLTQGLTITMLEGLCDE